MKKYMCIQIYFIIRGVIFKTVIRLFLRICNVSFNINNRNKTESTAFKYFKKTQTSKKLHYPLIFELKWISSFKKNIFIF